MCNSVINLFPDIEVWIDDFLDSYQTDFTELDEPPAVDLLANFNQNSYVGFGEYGINAEGDIAAHEFVPLSSILKRSVTAPIVAQCVHHASINRNIYKRRIVLMT